MSATRTVVAAAPERLDALVRRELPAASTRLVRRLIAEGSVRVDGRRAAKGTLVQPGAEVLVPVLAPLAPDPALALDVLYLDARVIAVDKPGGVPGHALDPRSRGTVAAALLARHPELAAVGDPLAPGLVHRLDTGTSGVLVAARTAADHAALRAYFRAHEVVKRYVAVVLGAPRAGTVVDTPLAHSTSDRRCMRAARRGDRAWPAETRIVAVEPRGAWSLVHVEIRTGVTHQVRVHLAMIGHPVLGDALYGGPPAPLLPPRRHALHAAEITIVPWSLTVTAPRPVDLVPPRAS